ncbi:hypothetical protein ACPV4X_25195 [Vibrio owensii]|uniref:hypothetical protein n=1 Tax=Vibrio owensii TaxID=696485 RepID=UPI0040694F77
MRLKKTPTLLTLIASVLVLAGCQSTQPSRTTNNIDCKPIAPQLEWYSVDEGGVYYPKQSYTNLQLYIEALNNCIDDHQE